MLFSKFRVQQTIWTPTLPHLLHGLLFKHENFEWREKKILCPLEPTETTQANQWPLMQNHPIPEFRKEGRVSWDALIYVKCNLSDNVVGRGGHRHLKKCQQPTWTP